MHEPDTASGRPRVGWGLGDVLAGLVLVFTLPAATAVTLGSVAGVGPSDPPRWYVMSVLAAGWVGLGVWPVVVARLKGRGTRRDFGLAVRGRDLWVGGVTAIPVLVGIYAIELGSPGEPVRRPSVELLLPAEGAGVGEMVVLAVGLVVVTPVVEELFFRGLVLRAAERRWGKVFGLALSTVVFALVHLEPGVTAAPRLLAEIGLLGLVLGLLAVRFGRLGASIAAHAAVNAVGVGVAFALN